MQVGHLAHMCCGPLGRLLGYRHQPCLCNGSDAGRQRGPDAGVAEPSKGHCMHRSLASAIDLCAYSTQKVLPYGACQ